MELYMGNNLISNHKAIIWLKPLSKLIILDLSGNPMARDDAYRTYAIFHLKKLKVLDSLSIDHSETQRAKDQFAGRLTEEILESKT